MFDRFYNKDIVDVVAYGIDKYDFTPDLLGFGTSIGETGYMEIVFSNGTLYFSTDGISESAPFRPNTQKLPAERFRKDILGKTLKSIDFTDNEYTVCLDGCDPITCSWEQNDGHCDRDYFEITVWNPEGDLYYSSR